MGLKIKWSKEAKDTYRSILIYLTEYWSVKEVDTFINRTNNLLAIIAKYPYAFKASSHKMVRKAVIGKQNSLFYSIKKEEIYLATFWDNRMDPIKNKFY